MRESINTRKVVESAGGKPRAIGIDGKYFLTLDGQTTGAEISQEMADTINTRLDFARSYDEAQSRTKLGSELAHSNCYGAVAVLFGIQRYISGSLDLQSKIIRTDNFVPIVPLAEYSTYADLKRELLNAGQLPLVISVGQHEHHVFTLLGFDENGRGVVFQKSNLSVNYPWEVVSLEEIYARYCVDAYRNRLEGVTIYKPTPSKPRTLLKRMGDRT